MNTKLNTREIGQLLNRSTAQIDKNTADKLFAARRVALRHQQTAQLAPVQAWLTEHGLIHHGASHSHKAFNWGAAALLAAILFSGALYWQQQSYDHSDIDIAILTDDLPVDMFVD